MISLGAESGDLRAHRRVYCSCGVDISTKIRLLHQDGAWDKVSSNGDEMKVGESERGDLQCLIFHHNLSTSQLAAHRPF